MSQDPSGLPPQDHRPTPVADFFLIAGFIGFIIIVCLGLGATF